MEMKVLREKPPKHGWYSSGEQNKKGKIRTETVAGYLSLHAATRFKFIETGEEVVLRSKWCEAKEIDAARKTEMQVRKRIECQGRRPYLHLNEQ